LEKEESLGPFSLGREGFGYLCNFFIGKNAVAFFFYFLGKWAARYLKGL